MVRRYAIFIAIFASIVNTIFCATIGSDTSPSRINTQQILQTGDRVAGFAALAGGLRLLTFNTTATFDSFFGVSGRADLNGATLVLTRDLIFDNVASFDTVGHIFGNNHIVELSSSMDAIPLNQPHDCSVSLITSINVGSQIASVAWSYDDQYLAIGTAAGNVAVYQFDGTTLTLIDTVSPGGTVFCVHWHPLQYCVAACRSAGFLGLGDQLFVYSFSGVTLTEISSDTYSAFLVAAALNSVSWHPSGLYLAIGGARAGQQLRIYQANNDCTINTGSAVNFNTGQTINPDCLEWNTTGTFLAAGATDLLIYQFNPLPSITAILNASTSGSLNCRGVSWNSIITDYLAAGFQTSTQRLRIYSHNGVAGALTQVAAQTTSISVRDVSWNPLSVQCLAVGTDASAGGEFLTFEFNPIALTLTQVSSFENGTQTGAAKWSHNGLYVATGDDAGKLAVYQNNTVDSCSTWTNVKVVLNTDLTLRCCLTLSGNSAIYGMGNRLTLAASSTLLFDRFANISLYDVTIEGISDFKFGCLDNTTSLTLVDTILVLDENYSFTVGRLNILGEVAIRSSDNIFTYQSTQPITIQSNSELMIDSGTTFSYAPVSNASNLFQFIDASSLLKLNTATLFASTAGLNLTKGTLLIDGFSLLSSMGTNTAQAISFGNGVSSANNMTIEFLPAGVLSCNGFIVDNNV